MLWALSITNCGGQRLQITSALVQFEHKMVNLGIPDTLFLSPTTGHQSNQVSSSNAMELEGFKRSMEWLNENGLYVAKVITDRHLQIMH